MKGKGAFFVSILSIGLLLNCTATEIVKQEELKDYSRKYTYEDGVKFLDTAFYYHYQMEDKVQALNYCLKARAIFEKYSPVKLAVCLHELGMLYEDIGQYSKAIECYKEGIEIDKTLRNYQDLASKLGNLALVYSAIGDHYTAIEYYDKGIEIDKQTNNILHLCDSYFNLGHVYIDLERYPEAINTFEKIFHIMDANAHLQKDSKLNKLSVEAGIFMAYLFDGQFDEAQSYLAILNESYHRPFHTALYSFYTENYQNAVSEFSTTLSGSFRPYTPKIKSNRQGGSFNLSITLEPNKNPTRKFVKSIDDIIAANIGLGKSYENLENYDKALNCYTEVISRGEQQRNNLTNDQKKYFYSKRMSGFSIIDAYEGASRILVRQGKYDEAYLMSERISARLFSEQYARRSKQSLHIDKPADDITAKEMRLNQLIEEIQQKRLARDSKGKDQIDDWYERKEQKSIGTIATWALFKGGTKLARSLSNALEDQKLEDLVEERDKLIGEIKEQKGASTKYIAVNYPEPEKVEYLDMRSSEVVIKYEVTDNSTIIWVIRDKKIVHCEEIDILKKLLKSMIESYRSYFENVRTTDDLRKFDTKISYQLYSILFRKIEKFLSPNERVIIIPDEHLSMLPFATLVSSNENGIKYLSEKYSLTFFQSVSALDLYRNLANPKIPQKDLLIIADPDFSQQEFQTSSVGNAGTVNLMRSIEENGRSTFRSLPKTKGMAKSISSMFEGNSEMLIGSDACEASIRQTKLSDFKYIVFATHGILKGQSELVNEPSLILTKTGTSEDSDGFLTAGEVIDLELNSQLVSLTACHTGEGELLEGEGVMGLFRSFQHAGAQNVISTLWAVSEEASTAYNQYLFHHLQQGADILTAYRQSIKELRQTGYDNPFYWGAFILVGI